MKERLLYLTIGLLIGIVFIAIQSADAQAPGIVLEWKVFHSDQYGMDVYCALLDNGDVYWRPGTPQSGAELIFSGNFWESIPTPLSPIDYWEFLSIGGQWVNINSNFREWRYLSEVDSIFN